MGRLTDTISGGIATFRTPGKQAIRHLKAYFSPRQEGTGTPSPENVRPIVPWDGVTVYQRGKNLWSPLAEPDVIGTYYGWYAPVHSKTGKNIRMTTTVIDPDVEAKTYCGISKDGSASYGGTRWFWSNANPGAYNISASNDYDYISLYPPRFAADVAKRINAMVTIDGEDTTYEPYHGQTHPITFPSPVYGGYVDLVTGEVWAEWGYVELSTLYWRFRNAVFDGVVPNGSLRGKYNTMNATAYCNTRSQVGVAYSAVGENEFDFGYGYINASTCSIIIKDNNHTAVDDSFLASLAGQHLVYELENPQLLTTLTPTELHTFIGTNNIWCNSGDMEVEYDFAESREMWESRLRTMMMAMMKGGYNLKIKKIGSYTLSESWENDTKGNPVAIMDTVVPDRDDTLLAICYWLEFKGNTASNVTYRVDGLLWVPLDNNKGFLIRNNKSTYRTNAASTSAWASIGTIINIYKINLFD